MEKIAIIGIGGRTGTLFAEQLKRSAEILGVARAQEIELIKAKKLLVRKRGFEAQAFEGKIIEDKNFAAEATPDYILVSTRYPVHPVVKYYYQTVKEKNGKIPALILSQNGFEVIEEAVSALQEIFQGEASKVQIIRLNLFNAVDGVKTGDKLCLKYFEPIRLVFSSAFGPIDTAGFREILMKAGVEFKEYQRKDCRDMEYSKLFLNLIGMASASWGKSVQNGFKDKNIFQEEIAALREYAETVKLAGGRFINFKHYPVKNLSDIINYMPMPLLVVLRNILGGLISKGRGDKPKDISEADHYNGAIIKLAQKFGAQTPVNIKIYNKIKSIRLQVK
jgi:ketopantoate reductase